VRFLLDTVTLIFAVKAPERLGRQAANIFADPNEILILSAVSVSEIAIKAARGKFDFSFFDLRTAIEDLHLQTLPYTMDHAFCLFDLPLRHTDPFDRQLIAQALGEGIPIVSCDQEFRLYEGLQIVW
jgi:PIN domain nuclease of toxin-antitoxin system